jgi:hypothetical protein
VGVGGVLHQETSHGGGGGCFAPRDQPWWGWGVFCTKRPAMVGVGAYLRMFLHQERPALAMVVVALLEGRDQLECVFPQETSHGLGGGLLEAKRPAMVGACLRVFCTGGGLLVGVQLPFSSISSKNGHGYIM